MKTYAENPEVLLYKLMMWAKRVMIHSEYRVFLFFGNLKFLDRQAYMKDLIS